MDPDNDSCEEVAQELVQELLAKDNVACVDEIDKCELPPILVNKFTEEIEKAGNLHSRTMHQFKMDIGEIPSDEGVVPTTAAAVGWNQSSTFSSSGPSQMVEPPKSQPDGISSAASQQAPKPNQADVQDRFQMNGTAQPHAPPANTSSGSSTSSPHSTTGANQNAHFSAEHPTPSNQNTEQSETPKHVNDADHGVDLDVVANGKSSEGITKPNLQAQTKTETPTTLGQEAQIHTSQKDTFSFAEIGSHLADASGDVSKVKAESQPAKTSTQGESAASLPKASPEVEATMSDVSKEVEAAYRERMEELEKLRLQRRALWVHWTSPRRAVRGKHKSSSDHRIRYDDLQHSEGSGGWVVDERQNILDLFVDIVLAVVVICVQYKGGCQTASEQRSVDGMLEVPKGPVGAQRLDLEAVRDGSPHVDHVLHTEPSCQEEGKAREGGVGNGEEARESKHRKKGKEGRRR
eukprot:761430-Hanusia_phi.AAC.4